MNENLNLAEILKDCPKGTKLYSPVYGDVELEEVHLISKPDYPIEVRLSNNSLDSFTPDGRLYSCHNGECVLFPSKDQRDWSKFKPNKPKQPKFDPKKLKPFKKVLARRDGTTWYADFVSVSADETLNAPTLMGCNCFVMVVPYNDDTKHLAGTTEEAPEYYRYWED